jgi:hypothetical protein
MKRYVIFLRTECSLPQGLALIQEPFCESWMSVEDTTASSLDIKVRSANWHFMWLTEAHSCFGIGRTAESAYTNAIALALKKIQQRFNAAELSLVKITKYPGFQVARVVLNTRQIQQHPSLGLVDEMVLRGNAAS